MDFSHLRSSNMKMFRKLAVTFVPLMLSSTAALATYGNPAITISKNTRVNIDTPGAQTFCPTQMALLRAMTNTPSMGAC